MSTQYLTINEGDMMPVANIKRVMLIDDKDRDWMKNNTKISDPEKFKTKIETSAGKSFARQSLDEFAQQGIGFVQVTNQSYVPAGNIIKARNLTSKDFEKFLANTGRELSATFKSQVDTKAGNVLSTFTAQQVMQLMERPYAPSVQPQQATPEAASPKM